MYIVVAGVAESGENCGDCKVIFVIWESMFN